MGVYSPICILEIPAIVNFPLHSFGPSQDHTQLDWDNVYFMKQEGVNDKILI